MSLTLGVLLSGSGTNLQSIIDRIEEKSLDAEIGVVVSNRPDARGLQRAENHGIGNRVVDQKDYSSREEHEQAVLDILQENGVEAVILAGYMRLLGKRLVRAYPGRILNIHPSLLPSFKGMDAQKQAADFGVRISGATVHFVDEYLDNGPIIIQGAVAAIPGEKEEELAGRILEIEHRIYPQAIQWLAQGRLQINNGHVDLIDKSDSVKNVACSGDCLISPQLEKGF
ncbi:MAG: phosphoribosylglycinamide formyltransferase [Thermodesulfobacteriota bacterium]